MKQYQIVKSYLVTGYIHTQLGDVKREFLFSKKTSKEDSMKFYKEEKTRGIYFKITRKVIRISKEII